MKDSDRRKLEELWLRGHGCAKIANELGMNVNIVKLYCRRHGLSGDRQQEKIPEIDRDINEPRCKCCGIFITRKNGTKKRIFCSDKCRIAWWNNHQKLVNRKAEYAFICLNCEKRFAAYGNRERKY